MNECLISQDLHLLTKYVLLVSLSGAKKMKNQLLSSFVFLGLFLCAAATRDSNECVYSMYVKTGSIINGGTDSKISLSLSDSMGGSVWIPNLRRWGIMDSAHDYFERGNLDAFTGRGPCINSPVCLLNLTSDGLGKHHAWYCDSVEVTSTGPHKGCSQTTFYVDRWLALDVAPYQLNVILNNCLLAAPRNGNFILKSEVPQVSSSV